MANIPRLPQGRSLKGTGPYGDRLTFSVTSDGQVDLTTHDGVTVALLAPGGSSVVDLVALDAMDDKVAALLVPYVNMFLGDEGHVERYWRTKTYRMIGSPAPKNPATVATPKIVQPVKVAAPKKVEAPVQVVAPTPVPVTAPVEADSSAIPGLEHPKKVSVRKSSKGWLKVGDLAVREDDYQTLLDAWALRQAGVPASVMITGPAGTAKTALARAFAAANGLPFLKVDGGSIRTSDDWAGAVRQDPSTRTWAHRWSPFARVLLAQQPCVVLVDELTRTESTQALNGLMGLLDWTGSLQVPDANTVLTLPPGVFVIATANIGPEFVGTLPIDGAIRQRFPHGVRMDYPDPKIEADVLVDLTGVDKSIATRLVAMAGTQRQNRNDPQMYPSGNIVSTRTLQSIAQRIVTCGTDPRAAVMATLAAQFDPEDMKALSVCVDTQFPAQVVQDTDDVTEVDASSDNDRWTCPACGDTNDGASVVCARWNCSYTRPTGAGATIRLQNTQYPNP